MARTAILAAHLPLSLWPPAVDHATFVLKWILNKKLGWKTPYEVLWGKKPNLGNMKVFGCRAYKRIPREKIPKLNKMAPRAEIGFFLGYQASNIYKIWLPQRRSYAPVEVS